MNEGRLVFTQVLDLLHREEFDRCVARYPMTRQSRAFSARDQFLAMAFAQLTWRESLRDLEACLDGHPQAYAMGLRGRVTRTNLAYANEHRDWRIFADLAQLLIRKAQRLYAHDPILGGLEESVYALDSTTIDLCLTLFPWAPFRSTKAAVKLHTLMDLRGSIPVFMQLTDGLVPDLRVLDALSPEPGSILVMDRGYVDFARLYRLDCGHTWFVTRAKSNLRYYVTTSHRVDSTTGLRCDQSIALKVARSRADYPARLRRVRYRDPATGQSLVFLTNHFGLPALTIAELYRSRWQIELFFKWIKQHLRLKTFLGTSENAVKTQVWIALCVYLLVACLKKHYTIEASMGRILQILSVNPFQKVPLPELLTNFALSNEPFVSPNQLTFNDF